MKTSFPAGLPWRCCRAMGVAICAMGWFVAGGEVQAIECYLKLEGIPGEITSGNFEGWSKITNVTTQVSPGPPTDPPTIPPVPAALSLHVSKPLDKTSPLLALRCADAYPIPRLTLVCLDNSAVFLRIALRDAVVTSHATQAKDGLPVESVSFTYQKIEWSCLRENFITSGITSTFDLLTQQGGTKPRLPFVANLERRAGQTGLHVTCPVEGGHRYRIASNTSLTGPWTTLLEFTATEDGISDHTVDSVGRALFIRVDEVE